ncbi:MAG: aldehyde ferredoxin oxidoreductase C-terminal domain-containing protein, partial [Candidatus Thorarchaeota archaeon]
RQGLVPDRDDILPERVFTEPLTLGPKAGTTEAVYDRKQFEEDKQTWYQLRGCDAHGIPTKKTLRVLDLAFIIPSLEQVATLQEG